MQEWSTPLVLATCAFLAVLLWRVRPAWPWSGKRKASREALREARARIEAAKDPTARALALCDAADLTARPGVRLGGAAGLYQRALRTDPSSAAVVSRAVAGLASRPRALESLLWRTLAAASWTGDSRDAARIALDALRTLYEGPLRNAVRAKAFGHARDALS
jgi:hypothetical protein